MCERRCCRFSSQMQKQDRATQFGYSSCMGSQRVQAVPILGSYVFSGETSSLFPKKSLSLLSTSQGYPLAQNQYVLRDFQKALETTTAIKQRNISRKFCSNCAVSNLSLRGRCISRSLHDSAKFAISRLLTRNCCSLAVVVSVIFAWP